MAASSALTAELEGLQQQTTKTLQEIDDNFSRANELAASLFPVVREFVKQITAAEAECTVRVMRLGMVKARRSSLQPWHDAFLEVAGLRSQEKALSQTRTNRTATAKTPGGGRSRGPLKMDDLEEATRGPLTLFSPPVSTPFLKAAHNPGTISGYEIPFSSPEAKDEELEDALSSPEFASPQLPELSSRAEALLSALGGGFAHSQFSMSFADKSALRPTKPATLADAAAAAEGEDDDWPGMMSPGSDVDMPSLDGDEDSDHEGLSTPARTGALSRHSLAMMTRSQLLQSSEPKHASSSSAAAAAARATDSPFGVATPPHLRQSIESLALDASMIRSLAEDDEPQHRDDFDVSSFPPPFRTGSSATELIGVWTVVSSGEDADEHAWTVPQVLARLQAQGMPAVSASRVEMLLNLLESKAFLRRFQDKGVPHWRLTVSVA
jgi:hypothetical protein